jgi:hypothetical protein
MTTAVKWGMRVFLGWTAGTEVSSKARSDQWEWSTMSDNKEAKRLKTAPELERLILLEMHRHAVCAGVPAVTVREAFGRVDTNWEVAHINALGGAVPAPCQSICMAAVARLQQEYDLLPEFEIDMDF